MPLSSAVVAAGVMDATWYAITNLVLNGFTALGTVGAVVVAVYIAWRSIRDQNELRAEQIRGQAEQVFFVLEPTAQLDGTHRPKLMNYSGFPITDVYVLTEGTAALGRSEHLQVSAGRAEVFSRNATAGSFGAVSFRDAAGRHWVRLLDGSLFLASVPRPREGVLQVERVPGVDVPVTSAIRFSALPLRGAPVEVVVSESGVSGPSKRVLRRLVWHTDRTENWPAPDLTQ